MADRPMRPRKRPDRLGTSSKQVFNGSMEGRVKQASPVPVRFRPESETTGLKLYVGPNDPGINAGYDFWFQTPEGGGPT